MVLVVQFVNYTFCLMNAFSNANSNADLSKWFTVRSTIIGGLSGLLFSLAQKFFMSADRFSCVCPLDVAVHSAAADLRRLERCTG